MIEKLEFRIWIDEDGNPKYLTSGKGMSIAEAITAIMEIDEEFCDIVSAAHIGHLISKNKMLHSEE